MPYVPEADKITLGAFTVDGSAFGPEKKHLIKTRFLQDSGVVFGKFDVPFGIAYLEYPATENRFVNLPEVVQKTCCTAAGKSTSERRRTPSPSTTTSRSTS